MVAVIVTALTGRGGGAVVATAVAFAVLKSVPVAAVWAAPVLGGATRTDPSDLIALVPLVPLWWWSSSRARRPALLGPSILRIWLRVTLVGLAMVATTATSCDTRGVGAVYVRNGRLLAVASTREYGSDDGGATWQPWPADVPIDFDTLSASTKACVLATCFEVATDARLTATDDRGTTTVLELDERGLEQLAKLGNPDCACRAFAAVATVQAADGAHVVVSMGPGGALHRWPDGTWEWVRIGDFGPPAGSDTFFDIAVAGP